MHIAITGPVATENISQFLNGDTTALPSGYTGAPFMATLIGELLKRGHTVSAFTLSSDIPLNSDEVIAHGENFSMHYIPMRPKAWPFNGWRLGRILDLYYFERCGLKNTIKAASPDIVHAHWAYEFAWATLSTGLPHVITCHDSPFLIARFYNETTLKFKAYRWLRACMAKYVLSKAQSVTTVSPYMIEQIQPMCRVKVSVVPNPITAAAFALHQRPQQARARIMMVCNGWSKLKNGQTALSAFALLSQRLPAAELTVYGTDFGSNQLAQQWWQAQGLAGNIKFAGAVTHKQILEGMTRSDVLLHSSLEESFGAVLAEAMAMGVPVVAGAHSGAVPWVVGEGGLLVDVTMLEEIADALFALLSDIDLRQRLGKLGHEHASASFSAEVVANAYEQRYAAALKQVSKPSGEVMV